MSDALAFRLVCTASLFFPFQLAPGNMFLNPKLDNFVLGEGSSELVMIPVVVALSVRGLLLLSNGHAGSISFPSVRTRMCGSFLVALLSSDCCWLLGEDIYANA